MGNQTSEKTFSQRQLRVGELVKQNLGELFIHEKTKDVLILEKYTNAEAFPYEHRKQRCGFLCA